MTKKKLWLVAWVSLLLLSIVLVYWFYFSKPAAFPKDNRLITEINAHYPEGKVDVIQDTIMLDEHHAYVPFITENGIYGMSFWVWEKQKWNASTITTSGEPHIWKVNEMDTSTYHFVWNIGFEDSIQYLNLFLLRERSFQVAGSVVTYFPGVQIANRIDISNKSYGVVQIPTEWVSMMDTYSELMSFNEHSLFPEPFFNDHLRFFAWNAYDAKGNVTYVGLQSDGGTFHYGQERIEFLRFLDEMEIE